MKRFDTKYKKGEKLYCIKDVIWDDEIIFHKGETYTIDKIEYSHWGDLDKTTYVPFYIIKKKYGFCTSHEEFVVKEESHGGCGMSGYGPIDAHFKGIGQ